MPPLFAELVVELSSVILFLCGAVGAVVGLLFEKRAVLRPPRAPLRDCVP
jgi:hypothetical protein